MTPETVLQGKDRANSAELYMSMELGDRAWRLSCSDGARRPSRYTLAAGDVQALQGCVERARQHCGLSARAPVHACYEAGRDGWWLHRWLREHGIDNVVVDSSSIEVNRRARHAKTDRLDADKLLALLLRYHRGEVRVWTVLHEPTPEQEDERRTHRELQRLTKERTAHTNRIGSLLVLHNLRAGHIGGRDWARWWHSHAEQLPARLRSEIERECARLALVKQQIKAIEACRAEQVSQGQHPVAAQLTRLCAIGLRSAWILDKEVLGWRRFSNRRELASSLGLVPTPYASGTSEIEQGISKAGNKRGRVLLVELAWGWLRWQPHSELTRWFNQRFARAGKRSRRVGIVALARRLAVALWRYVNYGEVPAGAQLKVPA